MQGMYTCHLDVCHVEYGHCVKEQGVAAVILLPGGHACNS